MADRQMPRAQLDGGQVLDVNGAVAGQARPHEQRDVVAPGHERLLEELELVTGPSAMNCGEAFGFIPAEGEPSLHVDAADQEGGVDAMVDVAFVDVGFELACVRAMRSASPVVSTTHLGQDGVAAFLALEDGALDDIALQDRRGGPGVQQQPHLGLAHHLHGYGLERLRIDRRRPGDDAVERGRALRPVGGRRGVLRAPVGLLAAPAPPPWAAGP